MAIRILAECSTPEEAIKSAIEWAATECESEEDLREIIAELGEWIDQKVVKPLKDAVIAAANTIPDQVMGDALRRSVGLPPKPKSLWG